jgi:hypothetical protein
VLAKAFRSECAPRVHNRRNLARKRGLEKYESLYLSTASRLKRSIT